MLIVDFEERRAAQAAKDAAFSAHMEHLYAQYTVVEKAILTLRKRGNSDAEIADVLGFWADHIRRCGFARSLTRTA